MKRVSAFLFLLFCGCFTWQTAKYVSDAQSLYHDVKVLTSGKVGGQAFIPSQYGAIDADVAVLKSDYAQKNPLSLAQVHDFERNLAIFRKRDSLGATVAFWRISAPILDSSAWEICNGELKKNAQ